MTSESSALAAFFDLQGRQFAEKCTKCGLCLDACPVFPSMKAAQLGSGAVVERLIEVLTGGEPSDEVYELVYTCNRGCGLCAKACPEGLVPDYLALIPAAAKLAEHGLKPPQNVYQLMPGHRYNSPNFLSALQVKPSEACWMKKPPPDPKPVEMVVFTGCALTGTPHVLMESAAILDSMGLDFVILAGGDLCCGLAPTLWGDLQAAQRMGQELVDAIGAFKPKKVVFLCGACYITCLGIWPLFTAVPFQSQEMVQFLLENLGRIPLKNKVNKVVTLHDSCQVARIGASDLPRQLLQAIPGVTLVEMAHSKADALCCGGYTNTILPQITETMRRAPMDEARATGASVMATICGRCQQSFAPFEAQYPFEVQSFTTLLAEAIGVRYEDRFKKLFKNASVPGMLAESSENARANGLTPEEVGRVVPDYVARFRPRGG
jgi:heterodisulfide reductase subunit D